MLKYKVRHTRLLLLTVAVLFTLLLSRVSEVPWDANNTGDISKMYTISSRTTSRHQAIIDYLLALYSDEGAFYSWLQDIPTDPRVSTYRNVFSVYDPYVIFDSLGSTSLVDWSNSSEFLKSLVNTNHQKPEYNGLVNFSAGLSPGSVSLDIATRLFPMLGLEEWLYPDKIAQFIANSQASSGGFTSYDNDTLTPTMIYTWSALNALSNLGLLNVIDTDMALDFVLSCYSDSGGFSNMPGFEPLQDMVPLGLFSLQILGRSNLIRTENTTAYLLQNWDNSTGHVSDGTIVNTERLVWSLYTLGTLDRINLEATLSWVISCQSYLNGAFLPIPGYYIDSERLEWARAAVHILNLLNRIDLLDEVITITEYPEYTVPQWYIDYIDEHFGTTTPSHSPVIAILISVVPYLIIGLLCGAPAAYISWTNKKRRAERQAL
ncbi:MAG: hypothetical protein E3J86_08680 [Candidatus Thorarchaeota archaeon]|nr:MAG: hypothetical protein E3J86_08680 [Candidatus Thorarchaeota archaeon]